MDIFEICKKEGIEYPEPLTELYFDGGCRPNPRGVSAYGFVVVKDDEVIHKEGGLACEPFSDISCSEYSEFKALYESLLYCFSVGIRRLLVIGDCDMVISKAQKGRIRRRNTFSSLLEKIRNLLEKFEEIKFMIIPRRKNKAHLCMTPVWREIRKNTITFRIVNSAKIEKKYILK